MSMVLFQDLNQTTMLIHRGKKYLYTKEVCVRLGISEKTLYRILCSGAFTQPGDTFKIRRDRLYSEEAIDRYIDQQIQMAL